jgi:L-threonylcarbamoyladenylate synthase
MPTGSLNEIVHTALSGQIVSFPTDTVPALAVSPPYSVLIFAAKKRTSDKPLILMAASAADLWDYVQGTPAEREIWQQMTEKYWPGSLTLVLPASAKVPKSLNPKDPSTIGIRVPAHPIAQAILRHTGALATTSANLSGQAPLLTPEAIINTFPSVTALAPADSQAWGTMNSGQPSTVARWNGKDWDILRQGAILL